MLDIEIKDNEIIYNLVTVIYAILSIKKSCDLTDTIYQER